MSYNELGNMPADVVEALWTSWKVRQALEQIEQNRRDLIMSLRANGMVDQEGMDKEMENIKQGYEEARAHVLGVAQNEMSASDEFVADTDTPFMQAGRGSG